MSEFKLENRYMVMKYLDLNDSLTNTEKEILDAIYTKVLIHRRERGKEELECAVIESDWTTFEAAKALIKTECKINKE